MSLDAHSAAPGPGGPADRLLPWGKVRDITGLSRTTAWRRQKAGDFPLAVQISPGRVGWWESELTAWKASRAPRSAASVLPAPALTPRPKTLPAPAPEPPAPLVKSAVTRKSAASRRRPTAGCEGQIVFEF